MSADLATAGRSTDARQYRQLPTLVALAVAGFRRFATYRQATVASIFTNSVFGYLRCFVLLAAAAGSVNGQPAGYSTEQLATYCWASQGLLGMVMLWGWTDLGDRIRTGDVVADLLRPVHPVIAYLAADIGRAAHASLTRFFVPMIIGSLSFDLYTPQRWFTYPLFALSVLLAVVVCFGCRYLINAVGFWLLDVRGVTLFWAFASSLLTGLAFPLWFFEDWPWLVAGVWILTPLPSILQAPLDVLVERGSTVQMLGIVAGQAVWAAVLLALCWYVQRRAERKLVIQGG